MTTGDHRSVSDNQKHSIPRNDKKSDGEEDDSGVLRPGSAKSISSNDNNSQSPSRSQASSSVGVYWKEDLSNLLTPQTVDEQAQVRRRKRNREAARRSRQRQKEREKELVERQAQLSDRLQFLEKELVEWRLINSTSAPANKADALVDTESTSKGAQSEPSSTDPPLSLIKPDQVASDNADDSELADNINNVYALTMETLHIISELQLQLDEITEELNQMIGS